VAHVFSTIGRIVTGFGAIDELGGLVADIADRALVVTGGGSLERSGALARARDSLRRAGVVFDQQPGIRGEPDLASVELVRRRVREGFGVVIGIGGGSVIDTVKAAAGLAGEDAPVRAFHAGREITARGVPHVAVPTTAGTGAEVTPNAVITDPDGPRKNSIRGAGLLPSAAIVDPQLLVGLPPRVTAETGMDALTQAIESYVSIHASPLSEAMSLQAISLLAVGLVSAFEDGSNLAARADCAYGALAAGVALANARLGVVHGIAHPIGARLKTAHGAACAALLAPSIRLNMAAAADKYDEVARRLIAGFSAAGSRGVTAPGITRDEVARRAPRADVLVEFLLDRLELPSTIAGLSADTFDAIIADSLPSGSLKANPLTVESSHVRRILDEVAP
jgi:alcohol dehydrogenase class IV